MSQSQESLVNDCAYENTNAYESTTSKNQGQKMKNPFTSVSRQSMNLMSVSTNSLLRFLLIAGLFVAFQNAALGSTLTVNVQRPKGNVAVPFAGAQVCISGNFGTQSTTTNSGGTATFANAPQGQITLTASASGFIGQSIQFTMGSLDKTQSFLLQPGSGGPICNPAPPPPPPVTLSSLALNPTSVNGGVSSQGTVNLSAAAPAGGAVVTLSSNNTSVATVPPSVNVSGSSSATFTVSTSPVSTAKSVIITASANGTTRTATLTVNPAPPATVTANLSVLVDRGTAVISGAAVCVTSGVGPVRSAVSDSSGRATFNDTPQGQVTITVSASGFTGQTHTSNLPAGGGTARFTLSEGSGGPVCSDPTPPPPPGPLSITSFDWHINRRTPLFFEIALAFAATRTPGGPVVPTHYRVGESSDLSGAPWIAFQGGVPLFQLGYKGNSLTAYGQRTLFLQLRKDDVTSPVASKTIDLQPLLTSEFRLEGSALLEMLTLAQNNGLPLTAQLVSVTENICGDISFQLSTLSFTFPSGSASDRDWVSVMQARMTDSSTKRFTAGWRVKSIEIPQSPDPRGTQTITGAADGNGFIVTMRLTVPRHPGSEPAVCLLNQFLLRAVVLEGPGDDMTLDQTKRWKNMFPQ